MNAMKSTRLGYRLIASSVVTSVSAAAFVLNDDRTSFQFKNAITSSSPKIGGSNLIRYAECEQSAFDPVSHTGIDGFEIMMLPDRAFESSHVIFGLLYGQNMIEEYDVYKKIDMDDTSGENGENVVIATVKFGRRLDGHTGVVHGGILSLILDDVLGFAFTALGIEMAFTANLTVDYRTPVPAGTRVKVLVQLEEREGRKLFWKAQITSTDGSTLYTEAKSLYIIPRSHAWEISAETTTNSSRLETSA